MDWCHATISGEQQVYLVALQIIHKTIAILSAVLTNLVVAQLRGDSKVTGTVTFEQASETANTTVTWNITGHDANAERGMHVHQFGDNTNGCTSAGPHCECLPPLWFVLTHVELSLT